MLDGFVSFEDVKHQILQSIGIELTNHHDPIFKRKHHKMSSENYSELFVTFKLKTSMEKKSLKKYFWYLKTSKAGKDDTISGEVVYPTLEEDITSVNIQTNKNQNRFDIKQIRIDGSKYKLSENQIRHWIELYGMIQSDFEEEAVLNEVDGTPTGTGANLALGRLERRLPIPMYCVMVSMSHNGICRKCYRYQQRDVSCAKHHWQDYVAQFKNDNP